MRWNVEPAVASMNPILAIGGGRVAVGLSKIHMGGGPLTLLLPLGRKAAFPFFMFTGT